MDAGGRIGPHCIMRKLIVCNIISVDGFYSGPNDDVMAMPFDVTFSDYNAERLRAARRYQRSGWR